MFPQTRKNTPTYALLGLAGVLGLFFANSSPLQQAHAELVAQSLQTFTLASEPTTIQLVGSGNYNDWHYVVQNAPTHGTIVAFNNVTGQALYQPNSGFTGIDSFTYKLVKNSNTAWYSMPATVKVAVVLPWEQYYNAKITPTMMASYIKNNSLSASTAPEIPGVTNIEPYKSTPEGAVRYANVKASWELSGQSWWSLTLGQKQWLMEQLPFKAGLEAGVFS